MPKPTQWAKGKPLDETIQHRLRLLIKEKGEEAAAQLFGISSKSVMRAAAGGGLRTATAFLIEAKLNGVKREKVA